MLDAITLIETFLSETENVANLLRDTKTLSAVERQFEIIGEAAYHLSETFKSVHPDIPWAEIQGLRHFLAHEYFGINASILWDAYLVDLPPLKKFLQTQLQQI